VRLPAFVAAKGQEKGNVGNSVTCFLSFNLNGASMWDAWVQIAGSQPTLSAAVATGGVKGFAKRKLASRTSSLFLVNLSVLSASQIE
jgi:hypothetical protein